VYKRTAIMGGGVNSNNGRSGMFFFLYQTSERVALRAGNGVIVL